MSLPIGVTVTNGIQRAVNRNGLVLVVVAALVGVGWQIVVTSLFGRVFPPEAPGSFGMAVVAPPAALGAAGLVLFFLISYVSVVAMRTFVAGETDRIPREFLRRRIPWVVANLIVGGLIYGVLVTIGTILLIVPGIIAYVSLLFMSIYIVVEDQSFASAMVDSWHLTRGNWIRLFLLLLIIVAPVTVVFGIVSTAISLSYGADSAVSQVVSGLLSMPLSIVLLGILAEAFVQLGGGRRAGNTGGAPETTAGETPTP